MTGILKKVVFGLLLFILCCILAFVWYRKASQPQINGELKLPGIVAPIDIVRDKEGVPHIYAKDTQDAYFALGFVHAQDRLWQLELNRRIAAGRTAEILGPNALDTDRFLRTLGVRRNAEKILNNLSSDTRGALESYAKGINAYLKNRTGPLPPEFILTGAPAPEAWQPADSIGWQTMMAWDLAANWSQEVLRMRLAQRLTYAQINEFLPPYPSDSVLPTQDYTQLYRSLPGLTGHLLKVADIAPPSRVDGMGSNNWVVSGARTETGKPLLANDPHLGLSAPGLWYFAHLSAPDLNVIGATLPGIPVVVLGHNDHIAWSFTNTASDVQDLYMERINPDNPRQYQTPSGWADFAIRKEIIKVKGQPDTQIEISDTRHGPVITGALPILGKVALDAKKYVVSFAWTALLPVDLTLQGGIKFNRAKNWNEFLQGAKDFGAPQQNMVYADIDGNIGFIAPGRVPVRSAQNDLKGLAPAPGWDARYDWKGFIPFDSLPRAFNPAIQRIATANEKIVSSDYPYFLTSEWTLPYRANRINVLLDAKQKHTVESFAAIQSDHVSLAAQELLPILRKTAARSEQGKRALKLLNHWDGAMDANKPEPLIFNAWVRAASRRIFQDELGESLMNDYWELRNVHQPMLNVLKNKEGQGRWCNDVSKPATGKLQTCDKVLTLSLDDALNGITQRYGKDMSRWQWGTAHQARSEHRPFGKVPALAWLFDVCIPTPGDTFTINVGRYNLRDEKEPFISRHAPGLRAIYDLADLENSRFIHSTGQSGNVFSPLYSSYTQRWAKVSYFPMKTQRAEVEKEQLGVLTIAPLTR